MDDNTQINQYFESRTCGRCEQLIGSSRLRYLRNDGNCIAVRVTCSSCGHVIGTAIVSMRDKPREAKTIGPPPITADDVIDAHLFFQSLGADWTKLLPKANKHKREGAKHRD